MIRKRLVFQATSLSYRTCSSGMFQLLDLALEFFDGRFLVVELASIEAYNTGLFGLGFDACSHDSSGGTLPGISAHGRVLLYRRSTDVPHQTLRLHTSSISAGDLASVDRCWED